MKTLQSIIFSTLTAAWMIALVWLFFPMSSPIVGLGGDSVTPNEIPVGGTIHILRNLRANREENVTVTRTLVRGDCRFNCEIVDLPGGNLSLKPGIYPNLLRDHVLPSTVEAGNWRVLFSMQWYDRIGRVHTEKLQELGFRVVDPKPQKQPIKEQHHA